MQGASQVGQLVCERGRRQPRTLPPFLGNNYFSAATQPPSSGHCHPEEPAPTAAQRITAAEHSSSLHHRAGARSLRSPRFLRGWGFGCLIVFLLRIMLNRTFFPPLFISPSQSVRFTVCKARMSSAESFALNFTVSLSFNRTPCLRHTMRWISTTQRCRTRGKPSQTTDVPANCVLILKINPIEILGRRLGEKAAGTRAEQKSRNQKDSFLPLHPSQPEVPAKPC